MNVKALQSRLNRRLEQIHKGYAVKNLKRLPSGEYWFDLAMGFNARDMAKVNRVCAGKRPERACVSPPWSKRHFRAPSLGLAGWPALLSPTGLHRSSRFLLSSPRGLSLPSPRSACTTAKAWAILCRLTGAGLQSNPA